MNSTKTFLSSSTRQILLWSTCVTTAPTATEKSPLTSGSSQTQSPCKKNYCSLSYNIPLQSSFIIRSSEDILLCLDHKLIYFDTCSWKKYNLQFRVNELWILLHDTWKTIIGCTATNNCYSIMTKKITHFLSWVALHSREACQLISWCSAALKKHQLKLHHPFCDSSLHWCEMGFKLD